MFSWLKKKPVSPRFEPLSPNDETELAQMRDILESMVRSNPEAVAALRETSGKLEFLQSAIDSGLLGDAPPAIPICMGVLFGDAMVQHTGWTWCICNDEYGRDKCVRVPGTSVQLNPVSMIVKRVQRGEKFDVFSLFDVSIAQARKAAAAAQATP